MLMYEALNMELLLGELGKRIILALWTLSWPFPASTMSYMVMLRVHVGFHTENSLIQRREK